MVASLLGVGGEMSSLGGGNFWGVSRDTINQSGGRSVWRPVSRRRPRVGSRICRGTVPVFGGSSSGGGGGIVGGEVGGPGGSDLGGVSNRLGSAMWRPRVGVARVTVLCAGHADSNQAEERDLQGVIQI